MSEVEYDSLLDAVQAAVAPISRKNQASPAANENQPNIPVPADW
jgi:hypothetical protein